MRHRLHRQPHCGKDHRPGGDCTGICIDKDHAANRINPTRVITARTPARVATAEGGKSDGPAPAARPAAERGSPLPSTGSGGDAGQSFLLLLVRAILALAAARLGLRRRTILNHDVHGHPANAG